MYATISQTETAPYTESQYLNNTDLASRGEQQWLADYRSQNLISFLVGLGFARDPEALGPSPLKAFFNY
jgi:hypothetical protein